MLSEISSPRLSMMATSASASARRRRRVCLACAKADSQGAGPAGWSSFWRATRRDSTVSGTVLGVIAGAPCKTSSPVIGCYRS